MHTQALLSAVPHVEPDSRIEVQQDLDDADAVVTEAVAAMGRRLATPGLPGLLDAEVEAGPGHVIWEGTDGSGRAVATGVYLCRLQAEGKVLSEKMTLLK